MEKTLLCELEGSVATIRFNRPKVGNSLSPEITNELKNIFLELKDNWKIRVIVLTGNGKYFCTGMDLSSNNQKKMGTLSAVLGFRFHSIL
jgi:enoyl-CoA hydratase/carnithine racemase